MNRKKSPKSMPPLDRHHKACASRPPMSSTNAGAQKLLRPRARRRRRLRHARRRPLRGAHAAPASVDFADVSELPGRFRLRSVVESHVHAHYLALPRASTLASRLRAAGRTPARPRRPARWAGSAPVRHRLRRGGAQVHRGACRAGSVPRATGNCGDGIRRVFGETKGVAGATPWLTTRPDWLRGLDLNQRPLGYEPNELPDCSTPR
jgi:hypothetical protein